MPASEPVEYGDEDYAQIHAAWVSNGYPFQFDMFSFTYAKTGKSGTAIFRVLDTSADNPTFYMYASWEYTTHDDESARESPIHKGALWAVKEDWLLRGGAKNAPGLDAGHDWQIDQRKNTVPNELAS